MHFNVVAFVAIFATWLAFFSSYTLANPLQGALSSWTTFDAIADTLFNMVWSEDLDRTARALGVLDANNILKVIHLSLFRTITLGKFPLFFF